MMDIHSMRNVIMFEIDVPWVKYRGPNYTVKVLTGTDELDPWDDNVDVEVEFGDGTRYGATFFTPENIRRLMEQWSRNQEPWCKQGLYFWCTDMVIVRELTVEAIAEVIEDLIAQGEFKEAFQLLKTETIEDEES